MALRDYQEKMVADLRAEFAKGARSVLAVLPTGGGKTVIAKDGVIAPALERGSRVWFVAPRRQLIEQTCKHLSRSGIERFGVMMADHWRNKPDAPIQVCSKDTLQRRLSTIRADRLPDILILDEAHKVSDDNGLGKIIEACPNALAIGFTATPCRLDGKGLGRCFDAMVEGPSIRWMIEEGWLVPPRVFRGPKPDLKGVRKTGGDWNQGELGDAMSGTKIVGRLVREYQRHSIDRTAVVFAVTVAHSKAIVEWFSEAGIPAGHVDANTPDHERKGLLEQLDEGKIRVLSSVGVFTEGFDMPSIGAVIFARPTKSLSLYIQMGGRGLRPRNGRAEEGEDCLFLDHAGLTWEHGPLDLERRWSLADGAEKAKRKPSCRHCGASLPGYVPICPKCRAVLKDTTEVDGEPDFVIPEGTDDELEEARIEHRRASSEERAARFAELAKEGYDNGRQPMWVNQVFRGEFGSFPGIHDQKFSPIKIRWNAIAKSWDYETEGYLLREGSFL